MEDSVIVISGTLSVLEEIRRHSPKMKIEVGGIKYNEKISIKEIIKKAKSVQANIIGTHYNITTKELVEEAHKNGLEVHVWTVNDKKTIEKMKEIGVDGITSNYIDRI